MGQGQKWSLYKIVYITIQCLFLFSLLSFSLKCTFQSAHCIKKYITVKVLTDSRSIQTRKCRHWQENFSLLSTQLSLMQTRSTSHNSWSEFSEDSPNLIFSTTVWIRFASKLSTVRFWQRKRKFAYINFYAKSNFLK